MNYYFDHTAFKAYNITLLNKRTYVPVQFHSRLEKKLALTMAQEISSSRTITSEYLLHPSDDEACHGKRRRIYHLPTKENDKIPFLDFQSSLQSSILTDEYISKVINDVKVASDKLRKYYETNDNNNNSKTTVSYFSVKKKQHRVKILIVIEMMIVSFVCWFVCLLVIFNFVINE